jgi:hypothetical protein
MWAAQATLVADAHVNIALPAVNSGAISNLDVGGGYTALLQFDLSMLPAGTASAKVSRAVLRLYVNRVTTPGQVTLAPLNATWGEYSVTYSTEPAIGSAAGTFSISQADSFIAIDVTALVQGWIANPTTNNGIALTATAAMVQFDSKENDQTAHPATIDIELMDAGPTGATGATGPAGPQGPAGTLGVSGIAGATGAVGLQGPQGQAGNPGAMGPIGPVGSQGPVGATGATGTTGAAGPAGAAGAAGLVYQGSYSSTTNYALGDVVFWQGASYISLIAVNHGNTPSLSPQQWGVLAAQGPAGSAGAAGAVGPQGPQGLPGSVGPNGPIGPQGTQGIAGQAGAQGIPGATGEQGLSGPMGPQGMTGPVGITFQGVYSSMTNYTLADGVSYMGAGYVSLVAGNHGNTPDQSPQQWALFAAAGTPGLTGPVGQTGATGSTGPIGQQGVPGPTGATGATGPQGPPVANYLGSYQSSINYALHDAVSWQGSTYVSLIAGNIGNTPSFSPSQWAVLAAQGATGATGPAGSPGAMGATGPAGANGATGPQGPPVTFRKEWLIDTAYALGDAVAYGGSSYVALSANAGREPDSSPVYWNLLAAAGASGPQGPLGATGMQGPSGFAGATGATGPQGPGGSAGPQGVPGATGQTGPQGPAGDTGAAGATGANGIPGTNGTNGANGAPGPPGINFKGAWAAGRGYAANDAVTFGTPASTYLALVANSSLQPDANPTAWSVLAQAGTVGPTGPSGTAATISLGTVATGAPGSQAVVTIIGTSSAAVVNFTIPQGVAGPPGSGGGGGGIAGGAIYHTVYSGAPLYLSYYSVSNSSTASLTGEQGTPTAPYSVLTWVPNGCTATALNVYSQQAGPITVTLRASTAPTPASMTDTTLVCASVAKGASCLATGSITIPAASFVDLRIDGADANPAAVWTALTCN